MLTENNIISAVCNYLTLEGYSNIESKNTKQQGIDIEATSPDGSKLYIEAKGETSSKPNSKRFGKPFANGQPIVHVSKAIYTALKLCETLKGDLPIKVGIAFPVEEKHKELLSYIKETLKDLDISVFWVNAELNVKVE